MLTAGETRTRSRRLDDETKQVTSSVSSVYPLHGCAMSLLSCHMSSTGNCSSSGRCLHTVTDFLQSLTDSTECREKQWAIVLLPSKCCHRAQRCLMNNEQWTVNRSFRTMVTKMCLRNENRQENQQMRRLCGVPFSQAMLPLFSAPAWTSDEFSRYLSEYLI